MRRNSSMFTSIRFYWKKKYFRLSNENECVLTALITKYLFGITQNPSSPLVESTEIAVQ